MATERQQIAYPTYYLPIQQDVFSFSAWAGVGGSPFGEAPDHGLWPISSILEHISPAELRRFVDRTNEVTLVSPPQLSTKPEPEPVATEVIIPLSDQRRRHQCPVCRKFFTQASSLRVHGRIHTGEKPFQCEICHKSFNQSGSLRLHRTVHSNERPYHCDVCKKSFSRVRSLRLHMKTHSGHKPYKCDQCDKAFTMRSNLRVHQKLHDDKRPFSCDICHKIFEKHETLVLHSRIHRGNKPFECEVCGKRFPTPQSLGSHEKTHDDSVKPLNGDSYTIKDVEKEKMTGISAAEEDGEEDEEEELEEEGKLFECEECSKTFPSPNSLRAHCRSHDRKRKKFKRSRGILRRTQY